MKVVALTAGVTAPSRRFRVEQVRPALAARGVHVVERVAPIVRTAPPPVGRHAPAGKAAYGAVKLAAQLPGVLATHRGDLTWIQKELLPGYRSFERLCGGPRVLDIDDAVWRTRPGSERHLRRLVADVDIVTAGNDYLAAWCRDAGAPTVVVPTAVDITRWTPSARVARPFTYGWIGQAGTLPALEALDEVLGDALRADPGSRVLVCADVRPSLPSVPRAQLAFVPWSPVVEVEAVRAMDVGLMPLPPGEWSNGKCAMKLLQYLACGVAAVATPTAANRAAADGGSAALLASSPDEWVEALALLRADGALRARLGAAGRRHVAATYSTEAVADLLAATFAAVLGAAAGT